MKIRPTHYRVQFERIPHPAPKKGDLIVPRPPSMEARVIAAGPKCEHVKAGDRVFIPLNIGHTVDGLEGRLCLEGEILAIIQK